MTKAEFREAVFTLEELATTCLNDSQEKDNVLAIIDQLLEESKWTLEPKQNVSNVHECSIC